MSIWGKIAGAGVGLAVGGPLGALLGAVAGHIVVDRALQDSEVVFTIALIALSAKMAKADGEVSDAEIRAFEEIFQVPPGEAKNVSRVYKVAQQDVAGFEAYARQVARIYQDRPAVLEDVIDALFHIAKADGHVHVQELEYLRIVADIFGFSEIEFARIRASHLGHEKGDPYLVLGITPGISDEDLKKAYRRLVRENHPDTLIARGVPKELVTIANEKLAAINVAYGKIVAQRGIAA
ncbi:heat shock protein DnaJ domain protein [Parvibaculum lavamentivorans DS-1]|uniref:Heat shock protein DnaJ domain protein n=1 Tax=Parvibaculum lavamentivorans (strain DS-1 / DSM 13023 / NCIMB 13966) TaxID=402881 RepID=A7HVT4_PARL1|nr:TerB family tellurite resistance protein [Parvibaculum lavamentivorans]ABS64017.1 heat shock protein DnaJ domain protein [Parvibaculum lavamentivorans DS-1]